jgi:D-alanyl-D-alanine-carboxypeptidase/D-alanyl-D-alanine-endopeptidase
VRNGSGASKDLYTDVKSAMSKAISEKGVDEAPQLYRKLKESYPDHYPCPEATFNTMEYQLLGRGKIREAVEVFKLGTIEFPDSWNAFDSCAEALMKAGKYEKAILNFQKSLELDPGNDNAEEMLKRLEVKIKEKPRKRR